MFSLVEPSEESNVVSVASTPSASAQIVGPGVGVGAGVSFWLVRLAPSEPSTQISVISTSSTQGTLNLQPHLRPTQPQ